MPVASAAEGQVTMRRVLLVLLLALATACGGSPKLSRLAPDAVVLAFGDSLTVGTGAQPQESYPARLETLIGRKVVAAGVPGEVSAAGLARLADVLEESKPKLVILCHGGNDLLRKLDERQAADNLRAMVRLARAQGAQVLLVGVPRPGLMPSAAAFYGDIAKEFRLAYDESTLAKILADNELKSDLVHPNAKGYARLAEGIAALLRKSGAI
jgi:lysophospholipase L1-like esterase